MNWNFSPRILIQGIDQNRAQEYLQQSPHHQQNIVGVKDATTLIRDASFVTLQIEQGLVYLGTDNETDVDS